MQQAARHVHDGAAQTQAHPYNDLTEAHLAVASFHGLLDAIERHVWHLVDPARVSTIYGTSSARDGTDPVEYAALRMVTSIPTLEDKDHRLPSTPTPIDHPWAYAAKALGAAIDLLATHTDGKGISRSPDGPVVWDFGARRRALGRVADLTGAALSCSETLGLRAGQAGAHWSNVRRWLPAFEESRAWAAQAVHRSKDRTGAGPLDDIGLANPPVRLFDPITELSDRITRLRRSAWGSLTHPDYSLATLHDFASIGLAVNAHCAAFHGVDLRHVADSPELARVPQIVRARAWQRVLGDLHDVISPGPGDSIVRTDTTAARHLLAEIAPLVESAGRSRTSRSTGEVLNGAVDTMAQIGAWNAMTYDRLASSGHVRIRAANLTGEQITDLPEYAAAKLRGTSVSVTPALHQRTLEHYRDAAERISNAQASSPPLPTFGPSPETLVMGRAQTS
ncbi:hypothetical protein HP550_13620 [Cellulomonas humilata]|uniref:Uncharacterized protein n=1 Tax=Cellulomonas humilata TaxID=144055 RepID=A0A7Y6A2A0_9CELL|nr:hypothetical protein [Cellulomonas humilata]NUU18290.1 hypothetical protein [Cellulomonas humilata]